MKEDVNPKMLIAGTISLLCAIIFFGGFAKDLWGGIFDFGKLTGQFPEWLKTSGGTSAKGGFLFALTLVPSVMLALGFVAIFEHYGALVAGLADLSEKITALSVPSAGLVGNPAPVTSVEDIILGAYQPNQTDAPASDFMKGVNK